MSKARLKKYLLTLTQEQVVDVVMELYDARKEAKEYLEFYLAPDSKAELERYKKTIRREFFPARGDAMHPSLAKCKKLVSDFQKMKAESTHVADLMLHFIEQASEYSAAYGGDMGERYYITLENNFSRYMEYIFMNGLLINFYERIERLIRLANRSGYGFGDGLQETYGRYR